MTTRTFSKRFALLVGIDSYQAGQRNGRDGNPVFLRNLSGCVNDVHAMKSFLGDKFRLDKVHILTSTVSPTTGIPVESTDLLPTFDNIRQKFAVITEEACNGDLFFFHFSGHGAHLQKLDKSPQDGRSSDPSLMTSDYCSGGPALRGWQLNEWLKTLHERGVQVVACLDSCYSGGSWRTHECLRTPDDWSLPPNSAADAEAAKENISESATTRDGTLPSCWGIHPERFTLMAACLVDQGAAEKSFGGMTYGVFTYELLKYLEELWPRVATYRLLCDQIATRTERQNPKVYGRDRLAFFGNHEPFLSVPIICEVAGDTAVVPMGRIHGIHSGAEFTTASLAPSISLVIDRVDPFSCTAKISADVAQKLRGHSEIILSKWSLGGDKMSIKLEAGLGSTFQQLFDDKLHGRLSGDFEISVGKISDAVPSGFAVTKSQNGGIHIWGPPGVVGYKGSIRGLDGPSLEEQAASAALKLAHLIRFGQVLKLSNDSTHGTMPFEVALQSPQHPNEQTLLDGEILQYSLKSNAETPLFWVILALDPGFHVKQLFPSRDDFEMVSSGGSKSFKLRMNIPYQLRKGGSYDQEHFHRDIIRTVVSTDPLPSFKSMEMPDIWDADQAVYEDWEHFVRNGVPRRQAVQSAGLTWWIHDVVLHSQLPCREVASQ